MGSLSLLQGIFPTHGSNPGLWQILYQLSPKGSPRILDWVVFYPILSPRILDWVIFYPILSPANLPYPGNEPESAALQVDSLPTEIVSLCPASFCTPRPNYPVTPGMSWLPIFASQSPTMKRRTFVCVCVLVLGFIGPHRPVQLQLNTNVI